VVLALAILMMGGQYGVFGLPSSFGTSASTRGSAPRVSILNPVTDVKRAPKVAAATVNGIDVSSYQGGSVNWGTVYSDGDNFAFARAVVYYDDPDSDFATNMVNGKAAGVYMGAYDFVYPASETATTDADYFNSIIKTYVASGYMYPALDLEEDCSASGGSMSASQITTWVNSWGTELQTDLVADGYSGVNPIVYMNSNYAENCIDSSTWGGWNLWIAEYYNTCATSPPPNTGVLSSYVYWQWCSTGSSGGIDPVDQDIFNGNLSQLVGGYTFGGSSSTVTTTYAMEDLTTSSSLSCGGTFQASNVIQFTATVSGGTAPYTYAWAFGDGATGTGNPATHMYKAAGTVDPTLTVTDSKGNHGTTGAGCSFAVTAPPVPTISSYTISPSPIPLGGTTYLNVTATGGTPPYTYSYTGLPTGCTSSNTSKLICVPTKTGNFSVTAKVVDLLSQTASSAKTLTVKSVPVSGPAVASFVASSPTVTVGGTVYFNVTATGGTLPYTYAYSGLPAGCLSGNTSSLACVPNTAATYSSITVLVVDAKGLSASGGPISVTVNPSSGPTVNTFTADPPTITLGGTTYLNVSVTGGTGVYTFNYSGLPSGCLTSNTSSLPCTPSAAGTFASIAVNVVDTRGSRASGGPISVTVNSVSGPTIASFTATPSTITLGATSALQASATGGVTPYTYSYTGLPTGCQSANASSLSCTPTVTGSFTVTLNVTDSARRSAVASLVLTVNTVGGPTISSFTASPASIPLGGSSYLNVTAVGGKAPLTYAYRGLPSGCLSASVVSLKCTPLQAGNFTITVVVTDSNAKNASKSTTLAIIPPVGYPTITSFTATPSTITIGATTLLQASATGGSTPYTYSYTGLPTGCQSANVSSLYCTPTVTGSYTVTVNVTDTARRSVGTNLVLTVNPSTVSPLKITAFTVSPNPIYEGNTTFFNVTATGGVSPLSYAYSGLPQGCSTADTATLSCSPTANGTYGVQVTVTDSSGSSVTASTFVTVLVQSTTTQPVATPWYSALTNLWVLIALVALVAVVVIIAVALHARSKKQSPPENSAPPETWQAQPDVPPWPPQDGGAPPPYQ
jgi:GH25 family lysozyme M1 (1,4-beta-N-acetylmuramidase)